jgi:23S rRNA (cytidine1920-2'-O)/16S rRNA (cytidine1409-2'-O)-methyltransferase
LLRRGAAKVYAADVGQGQLHASLARDPRVVSLERTDARRLDTALVPEPIDILVADLSFISLKLALPPTLALLARGGNLVALIKPQFEAGPGAVGKGGVVRDAAVHRRVCDEAAGWVRSKGWDVLGVEPSPITGPEGNVEFLLGAVKA